MERQSWCSHQSPVPIPLLFIILPATDTLLRLRRLSLSFSDYLPRSAVSVGRYTRCASAKPKGRPVTKQPSSNATYAPRPSTRLPYSFLSDYIFPARSFQLSTDFPPNFSAIHRTIRSDSPASFLCVRRRERRGRIPPVRTCPDESRYAFAPAASRNKCAFGQSSWCRP